MSPRSRRQPTVDAQPAPSVPVEPDASVTPAPKRRRRSIPRNRAQTSPAPPPLNGVHAQHAAGPVLEEEPLLDDAPRATSETAIQLPHVAMPRLMGQPAYARPARLVAYETPRPADPDDLPLEAFRTDEDRQLAEALEREESATATRNGYGKGGLRPSHSGGLRGIAARLLGVRQ